MTMAKSSKKQVQSPRLKEFQEHLNETSRTNIIVGYDFNFDDMDKYIDQNAQ
jgi:hypothetical protein